jgi:hypothetical protein
LFCAPFDSVKKDRKFQKFQLIQANFVQDCGSQTPTQQAGDTNRNYNSAQFSHFSTATWRRWSKHFGTSHTSVSVFTSYLWQQPEVS